jgi:hypothetical protein
MENLSGKRFGKLVAGPIGQHKWETVVSAEIKYPNKGTAKAHA